MPTYTRLVLNVTLDPEKKSIVDEVRLISQGEGTHEGRRAWMLNTSSYYHDNIQHCSLEYDTVGKFEKLSVVCDIKDYEDEIDWFLSFIAPAVLTDDLAGYVRYEESVAPDLVWFVDGRVFKFTPEVTLPPRRDDSSS